MNLRRLWVFFALLLPAQSVVGQGVLLQITPEQHRAMEQQRSIDAEHDWRALNGLTRSLEQRWAGTDRAWCMRVQHMGVDPDNQLHWPYGKRPGPCPVEIEG